MTERKKKATKPKVKKSPFSAESYNSVIDSTHLHSITIMKCEFEVKPAYFTPGAENELNFNRAAIQTNYDAEQNALGGLFRYEVEAISDGEVCLRCVADYFVAYGVDGEVDAAAAEAFCARVGIFAAYPYFRAHAAQMSWASNANLPPLPTISTRTKASASPD